MNSAMCTREATGYATKISQYDDRQPGCTDDSGEHSHTSSETGPIVGWSMPVDITVVSPLIRYSTWTR